MKGFIFGIMNKKRGIFLHYGNEILLAFLHYGNEDLWKKQAKMSWIGEAHMHKMLIFWDNVVNQTLWQKVIRVILM